MTCFSAIWPFLFFLWWGLRALRRKKGRKIFVILYYKACEKWISFIVFCFSKGPATCSQLAKQTKHAICKFCYHSVQPLYQNMNKYIKQKWELLSLLVKLPTQRKCIICGYPLFPDKGGKFQLLLDCLRTVSWRDATEMLLIFVGLRNLCIILHSLFMNLEQFFKC